MVDKKSPVKRLSVAKSTRAPRSKKLNLDKLITSIKNISTRYKRNGKMSGGEIEGFKNVKTEIEKFFMTTTALKFNTAIQNMLDDIKKIKDVPSSLEKFEISLTTLLIDPINKDTGKSAIEQLLHKDYSIGDQLNMSDKKERIKKRIEFFYHASKQSTLISPTADINIKDDPLLKKALSYIALTQIATTLAIIHNFIDKAE
jgi:hypothetical protein